MRKYNLLLLTVLAVTLLQTSCSQTTNEKEALVEKTHKKAVLETIHNRKSVRKFVEGKAVSETDIDALMRVAMTGPTGKNRQPWEIFVVDDREMLNQLAEGLPHAKMLSHAPMAIVVCGDTTKSSYWYLDCAIASQNILLAAESMGLGATYTAAYPYNERMNVINKVLNIPENVKPLNIIPVGHPDGEHLPKDKYDEKKIHRNKW